MQLLGFESSNKTVLFEVDRLVHNRHLLLGVKFPSELREALPTFHPRHQTFRIILVDLFTSVILLSRPVNFDLQTKRIERTIVDKFVPSVVKMSASDITT